MIPEILPLRDESTSASMMRVQVVHPDPSLRRQLLSQLQRDCELVVTECDGAECANACLRRCVPDVIMLDAPLLESVPISEFQDVGEPGAPLVVLLARSVEILETFPCNAIDEILLPASAESVARAMLRAKVEVQRSRVIDLDRRLRHAQATHAIHRPQLRRLAVKDGDRIVLLKTDEVDWIRAAGNYVRVFARGTSYLLRDTMGHVQAMLDPGMFLRVHRNAIVNLDRVQEFIAPADGNMYVVLREGSRVPLSRRYRGDLREVLRNAL